MATDREYMRKYREKNRERINAKHRAWYAANKDKHNARVRSYLARNPGRRRVWALKSRYGLTPERYDELLAAQDGCCAICRADRPGGRGDWHVDHCHATGTVRGILCARCNRVLGFMGDTVGALDRFIRYLEKSGGQTN